MLTIFGVTVALYFIRIETSDIISMSMTNMVSKVNSKQYNVNFYLN